MLGVYNETIQLTTTVFTLANNINEADNTMKRYTRVLSPSGFIMLQIIHRLLLPQRIYRL